jgi:hypothetical protein
MDERYREADAFPCKFSLGHIRCNIFLQRNGAGSFAGDLTTGRRKAASWNEVAGSLTVSGDTSKDYWFARD